MAFAGNSTTSLSSTPMPTPTMVSTPLNMTLKETGERSTWIGSVSGIISGALLLGLGLVLTLVQCRKRQIRKERLLKEHLYYTIGDRPPNPVAALADSSTDQPITLTNYVNLPQVEPASTKPIDIPGTTGTRNIAESITNSAYSGGIHYDRIPGESDSKPASTAASEHVYSVIKDKDEASAKKQAAAQTTRKQQKASEVASKGKAVVAERAKNGANMLGAVAQPVDMEGEGFIELLPRNMQAYDSLKRESHQEIQELSILLTSGTYDQLLSPEEEQSNKKDKKGFIFSPYGGESDDESPTSENDDNMNPYDDTVGIKSQLSSLQAIANGQNSDNNRDKNDPSAGSGKLNKKPVSLEVDQSSEMAHAYDAIDELQKQIHILSQSIPTLDLYGYEDLDKVKPTPKSSRSIPTLDVAGYEDLDAVVKPAQKQPIPKRQLNYTDIGFDSHFYESIMEKKAGRHSLGAVLDVEESPPSVPARTIESMYTAVQKKPKSSTIAAHAATGEKKAKRLEELYSTSKKSSSTTDLFEVPPPVPPLTVEAFYTAVQKPKKRPAAKSSARPGERDSPLLPPKGNIEENSPTVPPKTVASMYTVVQKQPKAKKATNVEVPTFEFEEVPPPIPPKTVEEAYLAAQKEGKIPPIPPRAHERVYSGVYRHKEKQTVL